MRAPVDANFHSVVANRALPLSLQGTKRRSNHERLLSQEVATDFAGARNDMRGQRFVYGRLTVSEACFYA
jgi:hypothetical protein